MPPGPQASSPRRAVRFIKVAASALALGWGLTAPGPAVASPRADPTSGRAVFTGAASTHPTSLYGNPANLGLEAGWRAYLAGTLTLDQEFIDRRTQDASGALSAGPAVSEVRGSPGGELVITWLPAERIAVGMGMRSAPAEGFMSASGVGYHSLGGKQRDFDFTFAGTFRVSSRFYFGTALSLSSTLLPDLAKQLTYIQSSLRVSFARDTAIAGGTAGTTASCGAGPCGLGNPEAAERYEIEVSPSATLSSLILGFVVRLGSETYIGVSYHTPPGFSVQSSLDGKATVTKAPRDGGETISGDASIDISYPASVEAGLRTPLPADSELVAGVRWEDTSRMAVYDVRLYGTDFAASGVPEWIRRSRGLRDAVALWAGVEQTERERWRLGARLGFERGSVEHERLSPGNNFADSITVDLGAQWRPPGSRWALQLGYGLAYFPSVTVTDSAYSAQNQIECVDSGYDYASDACRATRSGYGIDTASGDYSRYQHAFRLGLRYDR